jgi:hypothetical protein
MPVFGIQDIVDRQMASAIRTAVVLEEPWSASGV